MNLLQPTTHNNNQQTTNQTTTTKQSNTNIPYNYSVSYSSPLSDQSPNYLDCSDLITNISDSIKTNATCYLSCSSGAVTLVPSGPCSLASNECFYLSGQGRFDGNDVGCQYEESDFKEKDDKNRSKIQQNMTEKNKQDSYSQNLYLFAEEQTQTSDEEIAQQQKAITQQTSSESKLLPNIIHSLANYASTIPGAASSSKNGTATAGQPQPARMGTFIGVFLPCIQNIFGVILFIRLTWVVGTAGIICGFSIVFMCCCVTMLTAISMSAIATNGVVPGGGSYFMISRSLGPEFGGAVGILFYIGTTLAAAMYIVGAVEILITYIAPQISIFGDTNVPENMYNNYRAYGSVLLCLIGTIVYVGVQFVNKFASVALACVIFSIIAIYVGLGVNWNGNDKLPMCLLGNRLLREVTNCTKEPRGELWRIYCTSDDIYSCDNYFQHNELTVINGIKGLASGVIRDNLWPSFMSKGDVLAGRENGGDTSGSSDEMSRGGQSHGFEENGMQSDYNQVIIDITTTFTILVGIFFPSVTGIMAGSNRSGDLADAQKSIPIGTICAILTTSFVYLSSVVLFGGTVDNYLLRDKFGQSIGGRLVVANIAWPNEWVILIGSFLSTIGAGLQSLTGAPRLLQAIARDNIIPFLQPFQVSSKKGEPTRALVLTLCICECGVLLGNVDYLAPLLSMFFLMCYGFVNLACAVQTLLKTPNWRPRFKYYHWIGSSIGLGLCVTVMFMTSWYYALLAMGIAGVIYKYIEYRGAEKEWGDGITGLALSAARYALLRLEEGPPHTKNWRPQILILTSLEKDPNTQIYQPKQRKLFSFAGQLKAGKGLTMCGSVLQGDWNRSGAEAGLAKAVLKRLMEEEKVRGFVEVVVCEDVESGASCLIQSIGLGGLKPNTVLIGWPINWQEKHSEHRFLHFLRTIINGKMALLVPKGLQFYPDSGDRISGFIDIWWIVHDGGLLMLLPFLLKQHRTWKSCKMRIFTVAQIEDNSIQMKKDLKAFLYALRIDAEVEIVEMMPSDITAYTYERTLLMEQRAQMLREMNLNKKRRASLVDEVVTPAAVAVKLEVLDEDESLECEQPVEKKIVRFEGSDNEEEDADESVSTEKDASSQQSPINITNAQSNDANMKNGGNGSPSKKIGVGQESSSSKMCNSGGGSSGGTGQPDSDNLRRMHTALKLNEVIQAKSTEAKLVIINLPSPPKDKKKDSNYMDFLEVLTDGLDRVLLVRGSGREVITIYS